MKAAALHLVPGNKEGRKIEATEREGEPCSETEELLAKIDSLVAEEKLLGANRKSEVTPDPSDICATQGLLTEREEVTNSHQLSGWSS